MLQKLFWQQNKSCNLNKNDIQYEKNTVNLFRNTFEYHVLGLDGMHENRSYLKFTK